MLFRSKVPVQPMPSQPVKVDAALVGVALSVTAVPAPNDALHVAPQLMPAGDEATVPLPEPFLTTVSATGRAAVTHGEKSEVFPVESVVVAVTTDCPAGRAASVALKLALPLPSVVTD